MSYSDEELRLAVTQSISIAGTLKKLGKAPQGGNYKIIKQRISSANIDTSHFLGQGHSKGQSYGPRRPLEDYLSNTAKIKSYNLKNKLLSDGVKAHECEKCRLTEWNTFPIPLELHHVDGNSDNNTLTNLVLLCPNCHAQTDNYRGKAKKKTQSLNNVTSVMKVLEVTVCQVCSKPISKTATVCKKHRYNPPKIDWPPMDELLDRLAKSNYTRLAKELGVSDNAIRGHIKRNK